LIGYLYRITSERKPVELEVFEEPDIALEGLLGEGEVMAVG
jgi:hypothetical protein